MIRLLKLALIVRMFKVARWLSTVAERMLIEEQAWREHWRAHD